MDGRPQVEPITERQLEAARLIAEGRTNPEIADALGVSLAGAKYHVSELLGRLGLEGRDEIAEWYRREHGRRSLRELIGTPLGLLVGGAAVAIAAVAIILAMVALQDEGTPFAAPAASALEVIETPNGRWEVLPAPPVLLDDHFAVALGDREVLVSGTSDGGWTSVWAFDLDRGEYTRVAEATDWLGEAFAVRSSDGHVTVGVTDAARVFGPPSGRDDDPRAGVCRPGDTERGSAASAAIGQLRWELRSWTPGQGVLCPLELDEWTSELEAPASENSPPTQVPGRTAGLGLAPEGKVLIALEGFSVGSTPASGWGQLWRLSDSGHELTQLGFVNLTARGTGSPEQLGSMSLTTVMGRSFTAFVTNTDLAVVATNDGSSRVLVSSEDAAVELTVRGTGVWLSDDRLFMSGGYDSAEWEMLLESTMEQGVTVLLGERADHPRLRRDEFAATDRVLMVDPVSGEVTEAASLPAARVAHTATVLEDGRVLIAGGVPFGGWQRSRTAPPVAPPPVLYDPATDTYEELLDAPEVPPHLTATRLEDGSVLFLGTAFDDAERTSGVSTAIRFTPVAP